MARSKIPKHTEAQVLTDSARRCSLCFGLHNDLRERPGQIAHLDKNPNNNTITNLAFLCLEHHDRYDTITSQSKGFKIGEVKDYRSQLYTLIAKSRDTSSEIPKMSGDPRESRFEKLLESASKLSRISVRDEVYRLLSTLALAHHEPERAVEIGNRLSRINDHDEVIKEVINYYCKYSKYDEAESLLPKLSRYSVQDQIRKEIIILRIT